MRMAELYEGQRYYNVPSNTTQQLRGNLSQGAGLPWGNCRGDAYPVKSHVAKLLDSGAAQQEFLTRGSKTLSVPRYPPRRNAPYSLNKMA